jgi:hypothetical protein
MKMKKTNKFIFNKTAVTVLDNNQLFPINGGSLSCTLTNGFIGISKTYGQFTIVRD